MRSLIQIRTARAHALLHNGVRVEKVLGAAETDLGCVHPHTTPQVMGWIGPADLSADAGRCWLDPGKSEQAETAIGTGLQALDPRRTRTQAVFLTYRAESAARRWDAATAAADARAALDVAMELGAQRCVQLVTVLVDRLGERGEQTLMELRDCARGRLLESKRASGPMKASMDRQGHPRGRR